MKDLKQRLKQEIIDIYDHSDFECIESIYFGDEIGDIDVERLLGDTPENIAIYYKDGVVEEYQNGNISFKKFLKNIEEIYILVVGELENDEIVFSHEIFTVDLNGYDEFINTHKNKILYELVVKTNEFVNSNEEEDYEDMDFLTEIEYDFVEINTLGDYNNIDSYLENKMTDMEYCNFLKNNYPMDLPDNNNLFEKYKTYIITKNRDDIIDEIIA